MEYFAKCLPFDINLRGRIGGNPPEIIENLIPEDFLFYATVVHPKKDNYMLSILTHREFDTLIDNNVYPKIAVKVIEHEYSSQGLLDSKRIKDIDINSISDYTNTIDDREFFLLKVGGEPRLIQNNAFYYQQLIEDGYSYLLQIDEEGYSDNLLIKDYPFHYGTLFIYEHQDTHEIIAGFWQCS